MEVNPHVQWLELDDHGYVVVDVWPERVRAEWWAVDTVLEPSGDERLKSAWRSVTAPAACTTPTGRPRPPTR